MDELFGIAATSASDMWAVGEYFPNSNGPQHTLIEHWGGTMWGTISSPNNGVSYNQLTGVSADSASDAWAVGNYYSLATGQTLALIEHWNGSQWSIVPGRDVTQGEVLQQVAAISPDDVWACGYSANSPLIEHWNGTSWSIVTGASLPAGDQATLLGIVALSATNIWAVGTVTPSSGYDTPLFEHWDGTRWNLVAGQIPQGAPATLSAIAADGSNDMWAVGTTYNTSTQESETFIEHWNGTQWSIVPSPTIGNLSNYLFGVSAPDPTDAWAVGVTFGVPIILYWNGQTWQSQKSAYVNSGDSTLYSVVALSNTTAWAVGTYDSTTGAADTLVEKYHVITGSPPPWTLRPPMVRAAR